jgi:hypothetical protein
MKGNISSLMNEIANKLNDVSEYYFIRIEEVKNEINTTIENNLNFIDNFIEKLDLENRINNTQKAYNNIILINNQVKNYTLNLFDNLTNEINTVTEEQRNETKNELENSGRRLTEKYKIYHIDGLFNQLEKAYRRFSKNVSNIKEYIDLSSEYNIFFNKINDDINHITSHINSTYTYLKYIYPISQIDDYFINIENITETIKLRSFQFLINETIYITKTNNIKDEIKDFFQSQKINLKNNITGVLNSKIPEILIKSISVLNLLYPVTFNVPLKIIKFF